MTSPITINGRTVALSHDMDASQTDYIILRTKEGKPLNKRQKNELETFGVVVIEFVGNEIDQVYLCGFKDKSLEQINALHFVDYVGLYLPTFAVPDSLQADARAATVDVDILLQRDLEGLSSELLQKISDVAGVGPENIVVEEGAVQMKVPVDKLDSIAALDEVRVLHTSNEPALFNNVARRIMRFDEATSGSDKTFKGKGQIICVADTGLDKGSDTDIHEAFTGRVRQLHAWGRAAQKAADDLDGHGTHVCGSVLGKGHHSSEGLVEGTAPAAELIVQSVFSDFHPLSGGSRLGGIPKANLTPLFEQAYQAGARIHTNSWGSPLPATKIQRPYDGRAESIDQFVWEHQDMTILFAAGNDGQDIDSGGKLDGTVNERSLGAEAASKNCITVGATENLRPKLESGDQNRPYTYGGFWARRFAENPLRDDHMANNPEGLAAFSSRGPTAENRLKPDIVAPGTAILSARSQKKKNLASVNQAGPSGDDKYMYLSGTSMATPLVAGCCAIIREALFANGYQDEDNGVKNPTGSLVKALLINGAFPINGQYMPEDISNEPNPHSGFGRVDLAESLPKLSDTYSGYGIGTANEHDESSFQAEFPVPNAKVSGEKWTFKATLVYADQPGGELQNDLNLIVRNGDVEVHGNQRNRQYPMGSKEGFDRRNNVEQITWEQIVKGSVFITIRPFRFMSSRVPFAYAWRYY